MLKYSIQLGLCLMFLAVFSNTYAKEKAFTTKDGTLFLYGKKNTNDYNGYTQFRYKKTDKQTIFYPHKGTLTPADVEFWEVDVGENQNWKISAERGVIILSVLNQWVKPKGSVYHETTGCYMLITKSGCFVRMPEEYNCEGGGWSNPNSEVSTLLKKGRKTATETLKNVRSVRDSSVKSSFSMKTLLKNSIAEHFGITNILACQPISSKNIQSYQALYKNLNQYKVEPETSQLKKMLMKYNSKN